MDHGKNRCAGADPERKRENSNGGEAGRLPQHARGEAKVLQQPLQPEDTPDLACVFFYPSHIAELAQSRMTRCLRRHSPRDVILGLTFDVVANVLIQVLEHAPAKSHYRLSCSAGRRIRAIAPASLFHLLVSTANCRRPLAVRR